MPSNWPELSLALALALVAAYAVTAFLTRRIERWLRALIPDARERMLVDNPLPVVRALLFFITAAKWVPAQTRLFHLQAQVEGNQTSWPVLLKIR